MAGVAQAILWAIFSPGPAQDGPVGVIPFTIDSIAHGHFGDAFFRSGQLPSIFGLIVTARGTIDTGLCPGYSHRYTHCIDKV